MDRPTETIEYCRPNTLLGNVVEPIPTLVGWIDHLETLIVAWKRWVHTVPGNDIAKALFDAAVAIEGAEKPKTAEDVIGLALKRYSDDWDRWKVGEVADVDGLTEYIVNNLTEAGMLKDDA